MKIEVSKDLSRLDVAALGPECQNIFGVEDEEFPVASFDNPYLITDFFKIAQLEPGLRDSLLSLLMTDERILEYDGVISHHSSHKYPKVWSANIDTLFLAKNIKPFVENYTRDFFEAGTGSGFITQFALHHGRDISKAFVTDINPYALQSLEDNYQGYNEKIEPILTTPDSLGVEELPDLVICNPPYIPRPDASINNPYEGLRLIELLLEAKPKRLLINISSTSGDIFTEEPLDTKEVPLKVNTVTNGLSDSSKNWLNWLLDNNRLIEKDPEVFGYRYWHELRFYDIKS